MRSSLSVFVLLTRSFKYQFFLSAAMILVLDGASGKSYVTFPWPRNYVTNRKREERTLSSLSLKKRNLEALWVICARLWGMHPLSVCKYQRQRIEAALYYPLVRQRQRCRFGHTPWEAEWLPYCLWQTNPHRPEKALEPTDLFQSQESVYWNSGICHSLDVGDHKSWRQRQFMGGSPQV